MSDEIIVRCRGVRKRYGAGAVAAEALSGLDMTAAHGERVAVVGVSGSGKSTLLHLLAGLDRADAGEIEVCGARLDALGEDALCRWRNANIGFVYQFHHLLPEFTALENVALPLLIRARAKRDARDAAARLLERAGLAQRGANLPQELSGGERQRVAVCRALAARPALVLADEPTGNLDRDNARRVFDLMTAMSSEIGGTLIVATHDMRLAAGLDRTLELSNGRLSRAAPGPAKAAPDAAKTAPDTATGDA